MIQLKIGDLVTWASQSGGNWKRKTGVIVALPDHAEYPCYYANRAFADHIKMFDGMTWIGPLVSVRDGKTDKARPKLYMPRFASLKLAENEPTRLEVKDE